MKFSSAAQILLGNPLSSRETVPVWETVHAPSSSDEYAMSGPRDADDKGAGCSSFQHLIAIFYIVKSVVLRRLLDGTERFLLLNDWQQRPPAKMRLMSSGVS